MGNKDKIINDFFKQFFSQELNAVFKEQTPKDMMASTVDDNGWHNWKPMNGTFNLEDYQNIEKKFKVKFPESFIEWHKLYFFLDCDCALVRLPHSFPSEPLKEIIDVLDNDVAEELIAIKIYPFGAEGNDMGPLVFDGRKEMINNEFPIRFFDYDYYNDFEGLSEIIFSSFLKLLECITYFLKEIETRKIHEIIPDFFKIDPDGAGKTGIDYWLAQSAMAKENDELFGNQ
ncbi:hypothetical protein [Pedobacter suwonensis]|uniref:hypothetical protein n=1 Tax=Pedobacter suwonensis TaxID=332999 RepID=UPI0025D36DEB|nr:hypothetical protein [uncultured Pedobacter sp.]